MNLIRWNDDRLDGFDAAFQRLDHKVDQMDAELRDTIHDVQDIQQAKANHLSQNQFRWMVMATLVSNPLTAIAVFLITKGKATT